MIKFLKAKMSLRSTETFEEPHVRCSSRKKYLRIFLLCFICIFKRERLREKERERDGVCVCFQECYKEKVQTITKSGLLSIFFIPSIIEE